MQLNPEYYTAWNYRKLAVEHYLSGETNTETLSESIKSILDEELKVVSFHKKLYIIKVLVSSNFLYEGVPQVVNYLVCELKNVFCWISQIVRFTYFLL